MIINNITIKNFGIYYKENIYDFSIENDNKNIILIYGKNGSGKTTLLDSIKKVFYGCGTLGLKNPNKVYYEEILKKFNRKALYEGDNESFISINFSWKENNTIDNYIFKRVWTLNRKSDLEISINEKLIILKNNEIVDDEKVDDIENYFRTIFPQKLFDFFFFDGEDVKKLISTEFLQNELKDSIYTLFNIDIFKSLNIDLTSYIKSRSKSMKLKDHEVELLNLEEQLIEKNKTINKITESIAEVNLLIDDLKNKIKVKNERFKNIGGEIYTKKVSIEKKITELEILRSKDTEYLKTNLLNELSLHINKKLLKSALDQMKIEEESKEYHILLNKIEDNSLKILLSESLSFPITENDIENIKENIKLKFPKIEKIIHNAPLDNIIKLEQKLEMLDQLKEEVDKKIDERRCNQSELNSLKRKIAKLNNNKEFDLIISEINSYQSEVNILLEKKIALDNKLELKNQNFVELNKRAMFLKSTIIESRKNENKFNVVYKIKNILDKYITTKNLEQLELVKVYFIELFNSLHRKKDFIKNITINAESFEIKLFNEFGEVKNDSLSAGEKQIYILCLLGAFLKASNKEIPLIFDTLLGRLDMEHRVNIIKNYLPKVSKQILILSTDSEVTSENYEILSDSVSKEYNLEYNAAGQYVSIIKNK